MKIIKRSDYGIGVSYSREFQYRFAPGSGFSFPCDESGKMSLTNQAARDNFAKCLTGFVDGAEVRDLGVRKYETPWRTYTVGLCECGEKVELSGFTNTCDCGADYNMSGQRLADRSQWGEDTGEHPADIARIK